MVAFYDPKGFSVVYKVQLVTLLIIALWAKASEIKWTQKETTKQAKDHGDAFICLIKQVTWQDSSGVDPGPVIHSSTVDGKVNCACNKNARALRVNVVQFCKEVETWRQNFMCSSYEILK